MLVWTFFAFACTQPMGLDDAHRKHMDLYDWDIDNPDSTDNGGSGPDSTSIDSTM